MHGTRLVMALMAAGAIAACSDANPVSTGGDGHTRVLLTDAPPSGSLGRVDLYIKSIDATTTQDTSCSLNQLCSASGWVSIAQPQKTFNLLDLQQGTTALAGEVDLPAGQYQAVRVTINTALSSVTDAHGAPMTVQWPVSGELTLYAFVAHALDVTAQGAQIVIDFDVNQTFVDNGSGALWFIPVIRAVNNAETGSVAGLITGPDIEGNPTPIAGAYVMIKHSPGDELPNQVETSTRTDATGHYVASFVREGSYIVDVQGSSSARLLIGSKPVTVTAGAQAVANVALFRDSGSTDTTTTGGGGGTDTSTTGGGGTASGPVSTVAVQPVTQTVSVGDSVPVMAILKNDQGQSLSGRTVTWTLSDSTKINVFGSFGVWAVLRATHSGTVTITATSEGKSGTGTIVIR